MPPALRGHVGVVRVTPLLSDGIVSVVQSQDPPEGQATEEASKTPPRAPRGQGANETVKLVGIHFDVLRVAGALAAWCMTIMSD